MVFKRPQVSLLGKQRNRQHVMWCLITNTWATRVAIVSSVITRYLTLVNIRQSRFNLQICLCSVNQFHCIGCQFSAIVYQLSDSHSFDSVLFCLIWFCLTIQGSITWLFSVIFCSDSGIVIQEFLAHSTHKKQPSSKSINIIHHTAPYFVLHSMGIESLLPW
jgi:hypothetical protein